MVAMANIIFKLILKKHYFKHFNLKLWILILTNSALMLILFLFDLNFILILLLHKKSLKNILNKFKCKKYFT